MNQGVDALAIRVRRGLGWGAASTFSLRLANVTLGILLARLLSPNAFGVYAIALTVQAVLATLTDLGMSADLIRSQNPEPRAPTVATISLCSGLVLAALMAVTAGPVADLLGSRSAGPVIAVMSLTLIISSGGVVPYAKLTREFAQKQLFATSAVDFGVSTVVSIGLIFLGMGPMALALSRIASSTAATGLQFVLSHTRPRFGFDKTVAGTAFRFGLPLAAANMLSWALLNVDNAVIAKVAGDIALGYYVLAFNISNWPMSTIGQAIRSVSLPGFARTQSDHESEGGDQAAHRALATAMALSWSLALLAGVLLAVLSVPVVGVLYGSKWTASAGVLAALGLFGSLRVCFDLIASYLVAQGQARPVLWIQILWIVALTPSMILGVHWFGIVGGGWAHLAVGLVVILPGYLFVLRRIGVRAGLIMAALWPPIVAAVPAWFAAHVTSHAIGLPWLAVLGGGTAGLVVYAVTLGPWLRRIRTRMSSLTQS